MGRIPKAGFALQNVRVKVRRPSLGAVPCGAEAIAYLTCLDKSAHNEGSCRAAHAALDKCLRASAAMPRGTAHKPPVNFHLQKFIQAFKR